MRHLNSQQGSILIIVIVAMLLTSTLGVSIYNITTASTFTEILAHNNQKAYELARAGMRFAVLEYGSTPPNVDQTFYMPDADNAFNITIVNGVITSTGIVNGQTFTGSRRSITYNVKSSEASSSSSIITFENDMPNFSSPVVNTAAAITVNATNNTISLGGGVNDGHGSIWYQGSSSVGNCVDGACFFGRGLNAYFEFTFLDEDSSTTSTNSADGFTFAVISAIQNTRDRTGGAPPQRSIGELVGYAGPGTTTDKLGLKPPKIAVELDTYPNSSGDVCSAGSRNDANSGSESFRNHAALIFWGQRSISGNCDIGGVSYPKSTFDDNRHGAGSGDSPVNSSRPSSPDPASGYYEYNVGGARGFTCKSSTATCNWLEDGYKYSFRIELSRPATPTGSDYEYNAKVWVLSHNPASSGAASFNSLTASQKASFQDPIVSFTGIAPQIDRTFSISAADHADLSKIYFGLTQATGGRSQRVTIENLRAFFPSSTCSYSRTPDNATFTTAGGNGSISVSTTSSCAWMAATTDSWITITQGRNGMGSGTVYYSVAENTANAARTGYIVIAGTTFRIDQEGVPVCNYTLSSTSENYTATGGSGSFTVSTSSSCQWEPVSSVGWIDIVSPDNETSGSGTVTFTVEPNTGPARTGTITIADNVTFTITQSSGCTYSIFPTSASVGSPAGTGSFAVTTTAGCPWTAVSNNTSWLTITSGSSGTGSGTVNYSYTQNTSTTSPRTGTITVTDNNTFTLTQSELVLPTCTLSVGTNPVPYNSTTTLTWTITNGPANGSWSVSLGGTCSNFTNSNGGTCTTGAQTTAGLRNITLTVSNASGSTTCATSYYVGCQNYRVWNALGARYDFKVGNDCRARIRDLGEITSTSVRLDPNETITRYNNNSTCNTGASSTLTYIQAMNIDIGLNGGNGNCQVNFTGNGTATDR